jgi:hypothetical protein
MFDLEITDTFGGEANYCWVKREKIALPANASKRQLVQKAKALAGWTGWRCKVYDFGDLIRIEPQGACLVAFVSWMDGV